MSDRLRIAMLGARGVPATYGGVERAVEELSVRLVERGHHVTVYCRNPYCPSREPEYKGVRLRYLPVVNTKHLEAISHTTLATLDAIRSGFDVVHFHATGPALLVPLARLSHARVVVTVQGLDYRRAKWGPVAARALRVGAWSGAHFAHQTIAVSRTLQEHYRHAYGCDAVYAPNGVPSPAASTGAPPFGLAPQSYLLFLGRLVPEKAIHLLVDAYRGTDVQLPLVVAGPGSHTDQYVARLRRGTARDARIRFVGPVYGQEKDALLAHSLAFCQPSNLEGLPIAMLESMSHGRPPIVSDIPEHLEVVGDDAGFVFRRGDSGDLARVIEHVAGSFEDVERRGAVGRDIVARRYDWEGIVDRVEAVYADLSGRRTPDGRRDGRRTWGSS